MKRCGVSVNTIKMESNYLQSLLPTSSKIFRNTLMMVHQYLVGSRRNLSFLLVRHDMFRLSILSPLYPLVPSLKLYMITILTSQPGLTHIRENLMVSIQMIHLISYLKKSTKIFSNPTASGPYLQCAPLSSKTTMEFVLMLRAESFQLGIYNRGPGINLIAFLLSYLFL